VRPSAVALVPVLVFVIRSARSLTGADSPVFSVALLSGLPRIRLCPLAAMPTPPRATKRATRAIIVAGDGLRISSSVLEGFLESPP
jgi:hypothetical protein